MQRRAELGNTKFVQFGRAVNFQKRLMYWSVDNKTDNFPTNDNLWSRQWRIYRNSNDTSSKRTTKCTIIIEYKNIFKYINLNESVWLSTLQDFDFQYILNYSNVIKTSINT